jgi:hypothetical protein
MAALSMGSTLTYFIQLSSAPVPAAAASSSESTDRGITMVATGGIPVKATISTDPNIKLSFRPNPPKYIQVNLR